MTVSECESLVFEDNGYKCIIEKNKSKLSSCYDLKEVCESFIPNLPSSYSEEYPFDGICVMTLKKCEEMSYDLCDLWNEELEKSGYILNKYAFKG